MAHEIDTPYGPGATAAPASSRRLAHHIDVDVAELGPGLRASVPDEVGQPQIQVAGAQPPRTESEAPATRRPALALTAEGPRRADLIAWATAHEATLRTMRLLAPASVGALLAEHAGLSAEPLRPGAFGAAGLSIAGEIDGMIAFSDPIDVRPGDTTTRTLTRLAVFWDIPMAGNRATADLLLSRIVAERAAAAAEAGTDPDVIAAPEQPAHGAVKLWNIRATLDDVPGRLAILAASLARRGINILSVQVHLTSDGPVDELLVAASPLLSTADLASAVVDGGARAPRVTPADAHALVDGPTRALSLATRLLRSPDDLPTVLTSLLPGAEVTWRADEPPTTADDPSQLWLTDPAGGGYLLSRPAAPFTPAERARAYAMVDIAVLRYVRPTAEPAPQSWELVLADGEHLTVRPATPDDLNATVDLHQRCSLTSRLRRYLSGTRVPSTTTLARMLSPASGHALVAEDASGALVAVANLSWPSGAEQSSTGTPELAILVEDAWQRRRIGTFLARRLLATAEELGVGRVRAVMHASNTGMVRIMSGLGDRPGRRLHREYDGGLLTLIVSLRTESTVR